ncbi:hypothetical protein [uncultured Roseovarius sp.]|uniref:hypothetical protein n=1 Tax=uncultured Roseovarius sp. TaxID=293344 RepID=UPI002610EB2F|nr:hypothetical protein [uncultured Roseovarius sp.]
MFVLSYASGRGGVRGGQNHACSIEAPTNLQVKSGMVRPAVCLVRVKGLEPPRLSRQNLNSANIYSRQLLGLEVSQDIPETNSESAKLAADDQTKENAASFAEDHGAIFHETVKNLNAELTASWAARHSNNRPALGNAT